MSPPGRTLLSLHDRDNKLSGRPLLSGTLVTCAMTLCLTMACSSLAADDPDAVAVELNQARETHRISISAAEETFLKAVDEEFKTVAAKGDLERTKTLLAEKEAFQAGTGPVTHLGLLSEINRYLAQLRTADRALSRAYDSAVENYTKQLKIDEATAVRDEQKQFDEWQNAGDSDDAAGLLKDAVLVWTFDSSEIRTKDGTTFVTDLSSNKNDGRISGHRRVPRKPGTAVLFGGRGNSLVSEKNVGITGKQPRTFAMWFNIGMPGSTRMGSMFGWGMSDHSQQFRFGFWRNKYRLWTYGDATTRWLFDAVPGWHHVTVTYDGTTLRAYSNGNTASEVAHMININTKDSKLALNEAFLGAIDEVVVLPRALKPAEVKALYDQSRRGLGRPTGTSRIAGARAVAHRRSPWPPQPAVEKAAP